MSMSDDDAAAVARYNALEARAEAGEVDRSIEDATIDAVAEARNAGIITAMDDGAVAMLLRMADRMDDPDFPYIEGRFDNVTEGLFLKAARELGLTVGGRAVLPERKEPKGATRLSILRGAEQDRTGT